MNFWAKWGWLDFICYSIFLSAIISGFTIFFTHKETIEKIIKRNLEIYKIKNKSIFNITFHPFKKKPKDVEERLFPPSHPGGRKDIKLDEEAIHLILYEKHDIDSAWEKMEQDYIYLEISEHTDKEQQREYFRHEENKKSLKENFRKRIKRKLNSGQN